MSLPQPSVLSLSTGDDVVCTSAAVIGKSNRQAAGLAFHFEKQQVWTRPNHCIICAAAGGLSQRFVFFPVQFGGTAMDAERSREASRSYGQMQHAAASRQPPAMHPSARAWSTEEDAEHTRQRCAGAHLAIMPGRAIRPT